MKKILFIAVLLVSGIFTSCTDSTEESAELLQNETQLNTGEEDYDPDPDPDGDEDGN